MSDYTPDRVLDALIKAGWGGMPYAQIPKEIMDAAYSGEQVRPNGAKRSDPLVPKYKPAIRETLCRLCHCVVPFTSWRIPKYCVTCRAIEHRRQNKVWRSSR